MYMLDTNVIIMALKNINGAVISQLEKHIGNDVCISVITLGELEYGAKKSSDPERTRNGIYKFLSGIRVMDFDSKAAQHFGDIYGDLDMRGLRIGERDAMIAAHARSLGFTVVTNNIREFSHVQGIDYVDWSK